MTTDTAARPNVHELKSSTGSFEAIRKGRKTFELRQDDRNFQLHDWLVLREWDEGKYTGRACIVRVAYILRNTDIFGELLAPGVAALGILPYREPRSI